MTGTADIVEGGATSAAEIATYLRGEGQCERLLLAREGAPFADQEPASEAAYAIRIQGVQVDAEAGAGEMAWSRRPAAAAAFRGGLLLCGLEAIEALREAPVAGGAPLRAVIVCPRPRLAMALAVRRFFAHLMVDRPPRFRSDDVRARAAAAEAWIMNAEVEPDVTFGARCVIGCAGMGYERRDDGTLIGFPQLGSVIIEREVDIAAQATVQRGAIGVTRIRRGAKIGPHVNIGHNVDIGRNVLIAGHVQIGGGARIGEGAVLWQSCAVANGVRVGEGAVIGMGAQVLRDVPAGETWVGNPARALRR